MTTELLECPGLPAGYALAIHSTEKESRYWYLIYATAPGSYRPIFSHEGHPNRSANLEGATLAIHKHFERFPGLYPTSVRNRITTWLNTLIAPIENEQELF